MKLPGIGNIHTIISNKTKDGWKELQKNSSVAATKGRNFILDNMRPLSANRDVKARWSISASQKPVNRPVVPKNNNVDFAKLLNNVWLHKTSGSMPLKGINDKLKSSLSGTKIANSFFQKTSIVAVSDKDREALQARVTNLLGRLNAAQNAINISRINIIESGNLGNGVNRFELDDKFKKAYSEIISSIYSSKEIIHKIAQTNNYQRNSSLPKTRPSENQYFHLNRRLDNVELDIQSKLKKYKNIIDDFSES
ncbi:hypothetical protein [Mycetohabitans sp. B46]|uniref:hypothetical protein n=1 Tax=Mycetohabitans sp. B46 TaxID=2772536 RepID=UPI00307EDF33